MLVYDVTKNKNEATNDGKFMELFSELCEKWVRKLWMVMCKILLGAMVILKVHDVYGNREVQPVLW